MRRIALLMPGQGVQYVGMGKNLCEKYSIAKEVFEEASDALAFDLKKLCFEGPFEELKKTENTQPAILTFSMAAFKVFSQEYGIEPTCSIGHSLGEISALVCAGSIKFCDAVRLVRKRGIFMQEAVPVGVGSMAVIDGLDKGIVEVKCEKCAINGMAVTISNYNSPEQTVISGHRQAVAEVIEELRKLGGRVILLKVSAPFHSPLMQPAADRLKQELLEYNYKELKWDVISNVTALPYEGKDKIIENLTQQVVKSVKWSLSLEYLKTLNITHVLEIGPGNTLTNLMAKNNPDIIAYAFDNEIDLRKLKYEFNPSQSGNSVNRKKLMIILQRSLSIAICTQNRNFNNEEYLKGVVEPYKKVQHLQEQLEIEGRQADIEHVKEALLMLDSVFITKKTPLKEQIERYNQLFNETGVRHFFSH